ncbi:MAG: hypothetical protein RIC55_01415 [Pirellulaceae bacterium]
MSRMLKALKQLEARRRDESSADAAPNTTPNAAPPRDGADAATSVEGAASEVREACAVENAATEEPVAASADSDVEPVEATQDVVARSQQVVEDVTKTIVADLNSNEESPALVEPTRRTPPSASATLVLPVRRSEADEVNGDEVNGLDPRLESPAPQSPTDQEKIAERTMPAPEPAVTEVDDAGVDDAEVDDPVRDASEFVDSESDPTNAADSESLPEEAASPVVLESPEQQHDASADSRAESVEQRGEAAKREVSAAEVELPSYHSTSNIDADQLADVARFVNDLLETSKVDGQQPPAQAEETTQRGVGESAEQPRQANLDDASDDDAPTLRNPWSKRPPESGEVAGPGHTLVLGPGGFFNHEAAEEPDQRLETTQQDGASTSAADESVASSFPLDSVESDKSTGSDEPLDNQSPVSESSVEDAAEQLDPELENRLETPAIGLPEPSAEEEETAELEPEQFQLVDETPEEALDDQPSTDRPDVSVGEIKHADADADERPENEPPPTDEIAATEQPAEPVVDKTVEGDSQDLESEAVDHSVGDDASETPPSSSTKSTPDGLLKNRFQSPTRPPAPATSLEEEVRQRLDDALLGKAHQRMAETCRTQYPGDVAAALMLTAPEASRQLGETAFALAASLVDGQEDEEEFRVLVVDAGLSEKTLSERLKASSNPGLAEVLGRRKNWHDFICNTAQAQVDFLPAGEGMVTSYKSISGMLAPLIGQWKQQYRYIVFDAGGAEEPLTERLAPACDATYVQVAAGSTDAEAARDAVERLRAAGARLRGCVLVDEPARGGQQAGDG